MRCECTCHRSAKADYKAAVQHGRYQIAADLARSPTINATPSVDPANVVEAAVAQGCECLDTHCAALLTVRTPRERSELRVPVEWAPEPQGDAEGGES